MPYCSVIKQHANTVESVLNLAGSLWLHGHDIAFDKVNFLGKGVIKGKTTNSFIIYHYIDGTITACFGMSAELACRFDCASTHNMSYWDLRYQEKTAATLSGETC